MKTLNAFFKQKFDRWLSKRIPSCAQHQLNSRNIMIYPTRFGLAYLGVVLLIFLLGTNYQNNIILLFSYLLVSLFISVMLHSFYNFSSMHFYSAAKQQGYAGSELYFPIKITAKKTHFDINLHFTDKTLNSAKVNAVQCLAGDTIINLPYSPKQRGVNSLGRVTVFSEYSLGLFKSKTVLDFAHSATVYPQPLKLVTSQFHLSNQKQNQNEEDNNDTYQTSQQAGIDDFSELKSFVQGESKARTAWKQLAKGQGHYSKHYHESTSQLQWLTLNDMPAGDLETRLRYLSFLITELTISNQTFGLALSSNINGTSKNIAPNSGFIHQQACLTALALYS